MLRGVMEVKRGGIRVRREETETEVKTGISWSLEGWRRGHLRTAWVLGASSLPSQTAIKTKNPLALALA